jgi:hypothetical protein
VIGNSIFAGYRLVFEVEKNPFATLHSRNALDLILRFSQYSRNWIHQTLAFPKLVPIPKMGHGGRNQSFKNLNNRPDAVNFLDTTRFQPGCFFGAPPPGALSSHVT